MPFFVHMGMIYVPMGGKFDGIMENTVVHGGSSWGAGTISFGDGSRQPSQLELDFAQAQGEIVSFQKNILSYVLTSLNIPLRLGFWIACSKNEQLKKFLD
jgi:multimeric flavodoxin WrbA